jgi:hypothetical protein
VVRQARAPHEHGCFPCQRHAIPDFLAGVCPRQIPDLATREKTGKRVSDPLAPTDMGAFTDIHMPPSILPEGARKLDRAKRGGMLR